MHKKSPAILRDFPKIKPIITYSVMIIFFVTELPFTSNV